MAGKYKEDEVIIGAKGKTYAERKTSLLHQLGYHNVTKEHFAGLNEIQIDQKARTIMGLH